MLDQAGVCRVSGRPASHWGTERRRNNGSRQRRYLRHAGLGSCRGFPGNSRWWAPTLSPVLNDIEAQPPVPITLLCEAGSRDLRGGYKPALLFLSVDVAVKRILLVEDEPTTREILAEVLLGEGYAVDTVAGVSAANLCLRSLAYELVVSDWLLPDGDGVAVADAAAALGFKTLVVSGVISQLPGDAHLRHRLILKSLGPMAVVAAVRAAIGSP